MEELDREGQRLLQCIRSSDGFSGRNCISGSADFQSLVPKVCSLQLGIKTADETPQLYNLLKNYFVINDRVGIKGPQTCTGEKITKTGIFCQHEVWQ